MSKLAVLGFMLSACATTDRTFTASDTVTRARVHLELAGSAATTAVFPHPIDPVLPSVDRIGREVRGTLGETATARVELCVSPAGAVTRIALVEGSAFADFDQALVRDVAAWHFAARPGPGRVQTCTRARIAYRAS